MNLSQTKNDAGQDRKRPRVLIAGLFHETHTFLTQVTNWNAFTLYRGPEVFSLAGDASPMGGMLEFAAEHDWVVLPTIAAVAVPSGMVEDNVYDRFIDGFDQLAKGHLAEEVDGVFLVLHGALVSESHQDVEGDFLRHLRSLPGAAGVPVYGVFDLHAHLTDAMMEHSDCLVAYRENPHSDARESSIRAASLLHDAMATGNRPRQFALRPSIVWPPTGTGSADEPMRSLLLKARELEQKHPNFLAINVVPGFAFGDTYDTGLGFSVSTIGTDAEAMQALEQLSELAISRAEEGCRQDADVDKILCEFSISHVRDNDISGVNPSGFNHAGPDHAGPDHEGPNNAGPNNEGPWVIAEPSDNIGGGSPGDATGLLRALLRHNVSNAAVCLYDPEAVAGLQSHRVHEMVTLSIGGKSTALDPGPLEVTGKLIRLCGGQFELEDKQSHLASAVGDHFDMGSCAIIEVSGVTILLTSNPTPPMDLGQWRSVGLRPEGFAVIGVKAAVAHRRAYEPIAKKMVSVDTPGPCRSNLLTLPYRNLRRPAYPFDSIDSIKQTTPFTRS